MTTLTMGRVFRSVRTWNDRRLARTAFAKFSDRELYDIGLSVTDLDMIGRH
ncbi:DUF1127 domain-containing protein [Aestuariibius insulae]|uniref:DUF1127 domain-containing protein n=1 Tax=Aestuariibius insulae TaxID=2058287 RepID=UPI00345E806F